MRKALSLSLLTAMLSTVPATATAADINLIITILECESSGKHDAVGDDGVSYGIAQFRRETFYEFAAEAGFKNFNYRNPIHQLKAMIMDMVAGGLVTGSLRVYTMNRERETNYAEPAPRLCGVRVERRVRPLL